MYFIIIEARPVSPREEDKDQKGAFVSCWIDFKAEGGAIVLAEHAIRDNGWEPVRIDEVRPVERSDYEEGDEHLEFFDEADRDGASFLFHLWEEDDDEGEIRH